MILEKLNKKVNMKKLLEIGNRQECQANLGAQGGWGMEVRGDS